MEHLPLVVDGAQCTVIKGTHKGKSGTIRDIHTSKSGIITIPWCNPLV
ncbi:MAG: hypothetical protein RLZZ599_294 [Bacteroidota bacterium]|jgi:ribosomal protein L24